MLELELDNFEQAEKLLKDGLKICDDEEVDSYDDARTRLHHNLGNVYTELRNWKDARWHIGRDIQICKKLCHLQGEAKGYINLGELHYREQNYRDAKSCYNKALEVAQSLEDEDALMEQIRQNIETVKKAVEVFEKLKANEQKLKKLVRDTSNARGTSKERKLLLDQYACLDSLTENASMICAWEKVSGPHGNYYMIFSHLAINLDHQIQQNLLIIIIFILFISKFFFSFLILSYASA